MRVTKTLAGSTLVALGAAQSNITCQSGLHVIVARASGEQPGFGILGPVKDEILSRVSGSDAVAVPYPATITNPFYFTSQPEGVGNLTQLITQYGDACPEGRMALLGYSQGAHVIGDTLIGADYLQFPGLPNTTGIADRYVANVVAVIMMGDPANVANQPILVGNSTRNGTFPRNNTELWEGRGLVDRVQSFCDAGDFFCDSGNQSDSLNIHIGYVPEYGSRAADFVVSKAMGSNSTGSANATSTTSSTTATPTGSATHSSTSGPSSTRSGAAASSTTPAGSAATLGVSHGMYSMLGAVQCLVVFALFY